MKLSVVGLGQCGGKVADTLYDISRYSQSVFSRHINIVTDAFAINTDEADLGSFKNIPRDSSHRVLIGTMATFGHGVGKINSDAADIIKSSNSVVIDTMLRSPRFHESDAILIIAGAGGGTGSGTIGWLTKTLKERIDKPVYALLVLPFIFEEKGETSYAVINSATCFNTVQKYADAVFLFDNECYRHVKSNLADNLEEINQIIAMNFYDLCCAGEEHRRKYVGSKVIDAGDIRQSLSGISAVGRGEVDLPLIRWNPARYRQGIKENSLVFSALRQAETNLGLGIDLEYARKILILVTGPKDYISITVLEEIFNYLENKVPKAVIRIGDYPRRNHEVSVTLIASELVRVGRIEHMFTQAEYFMKRRDEINRDTITKIELMRELNSQIPTLD